MGIQGMRKAVAGPPPVRSKSPRTVCHWQKRVPGRMLPAAAHPLVIVASFGYAFGQDKCSDILASGLKNNIVTQKNDRSYNAGFYLACSLSYNEASKYFNSANSSATSAGGAVGYGPFSLGGNYGGSSSSAVSEGDFNKWKQDNCSQIPGQNAANAFEYYAQSVVAPGVVNAWKQCMVERDGLSCWAEDHGDVGGVDFVYNWKQPHYDPPTEHPTVASSTVKRTEEAIEQNVIPTGQTILIGTDDRFLEKPADQSIFISLNLQYKRQYAEKCSVYIPAAEPEAIPFKCGLNPGYVCNYAIYSKRQGRPVRYFSISAGVTTLIHGVLPNDLYCVSSSQPPSDPAQCTNSWDNPWRWHPRLVGDGDGFNPPDANPPHP